MKDEAGEGCQRELQDAAGGKKSKHSGEVGGIPSLRREQAKSKDEVGGVVSNNKLVVMQHHWCHKKEPIGRQKARKEEEK